MRLKQFDQGPVKAYAASASADTTHATFFALVCEQNLVPRSRLAIAVATISNPNLIKLVASGPVYWPPEKGERYVFIYENTLGDPLCAEGQYKGMDWNADIVQSAVIKPLAMLLLDMRDSDIAHGNIRPSNLYAARSGGNIDRVVLGDCLSVPAGFTQPVLFEPIERAMADPIARGEPTFDADLYAFGVTLAIILRSRDPMEGMNDDEIIRQKIEEGSYIALTGKDRFTGGVLELLRGLLNDDINQRWTVDDIINWLEGQRLSPRQGIKRMKAARPIHFNDERYFRPALLAMDLNKNQSEAVQMVESHAMEQWISRSLEDSSVQKRMDSVTESMSELGRGPGYWDKLLCHMSIALDPEAPIRYKGLVLHPEGIGTSLARAMVDRMDIQPYIDIINQQTALFWLMAQSGTNIDVGAIASKFDLSRAFLRQANNAYGIERCLYFLSPECHCISEKMKGFYVRNPEDMMRAYEKMSGAPDRPYLFFDRHTISFLSVKDRKSIDPYLVELNSEEDYKKISGTIKTLATIQQRSRLEKFPGICRWIADIADPIYERLHDRELRKTMKIKIAKLADLGDISRIAALIDNPQTFQDDLQLYNKARVDYYKLRQELAKLDGKLVEPGHFSAGIGREIAAIVSCIIAGLTILFFAFVFFTRGSIF